MLFRLASVKPKKNFGWNAIVVAVDGVVSTFYLYVSLLSVQPTHDINFSFVEAPTIAANALAQMEDNKISSKLQVNTIMGK